MKAFFRAIAASFRSPAPAEAFGGIVSFALIMYGGFILPKPSMIGALSWIGDINVSLLSVSEYAVSECGT